MSDVTNVLVEPEEHFPLLGDLYKLHITTADGKESVYNITGSIFISPRIVAAAVNNLVTVYIKDT